MIIVDASIAAKWIFWEKQSDEALAFWNKHAGNLGAPDLLSTEVAGAIVRVGNMRKELRDDMREALVKWSRLLSGTSMQLFRTSTSRVLLSGKMALDIGHPIKDCIYLQLAMEADATLITADRKFMPKAEKIWPKIASLEEF